MSSSVHLTGSLPPRSMLRGRYIIIGQAGRGGMGAVYEAVDTKRQPNRRVAIKEMSQSKLTGPEEVEKARKRFQREANILRSLDHPSLPHVYDSFEEDGRSYLVMEFIEGHTLLQLLQAQPGSPLPIAQVLSYACQLCEVLDYLHRQYPSIIFRDLKPANVMVKADGRIVLIDFGIARFFKPGQRSDTEFFGSLAYASPQQLDGEQTNVRSDLYSLGATLHHCLTGKVPGYAQHRLVYPSVRSMNSQVPPTLDRIVMSLVEVKEDRRPQSAQAVRQQLETALQEAAEAMRSFAQDSSLRLPPPLGAAQQPLRLPGNGTGASPDDLTYSANQQAYLTQPQTQGLRLLVSSSRNFVTWCTSTLFPALLSFFIGMLKFGRNSLDTLRRFLSGGAKNVSLADVGYGIRQGFAQMGHGMVIGYENIKLGISNWRSRVLTPGFTLLLLLRLAIVIAGTIYLSRVFNGSYSIVAFCLSLLLLFITGAASMSTRIRAPLAKNILFYTALAIFIACVALQATPDVQKVLRAITFSQLLTVVLAITSFILLVRTNNRVAWVDRVTIILITATFALLQFTLGYQELETVPGLTSNVYEPIRDGLTLLLALIAFIFLCRIARPFSGFDRLLLLVIVLIFAMLQFSVGYTELQRLSLLANHAAISAGKSSNVAYVDVLLIALPVIGVIVALCIGKRFQQTSRIAIALLATACIVLQNAAAQDVKIFLPSSTIYPLAKTVIDTFTLNQIVIYGGLLVAGLLLFVRLFLKATWIDRSAVFIVALICALFQLSLATQMVQPSFLTSGTSGISQDLLLALHQIVGGILLLVTICGIVLAIFIPLVRLMRQTSSWIDQKAASIEDQFTWIDRVLAGIDRVAVSGITLTATLLILFLGGNEGPNHIFSQVIDMQGMPIPIYVFSALILAFLTFVSLFRLNKSFNRWDNITMLLVVIACLLLLFDNTGLQHISVPILTNVQGFLGHLLQGRVPYILFFIGLIATATLSLLWLRRTLPRDQVLYVVLALLFFSALACAVLQYLWPVLLLTGLIMLIHGVFVAIQMERVR